MSDELKKKGTWCLQNKDGYSLLPWCTGLGRDWAMKLYRAILERSPHEAGDWKERPVALAFLDEEEQSK